MHRFRLNVSNPTATAEITVSKYMDSNSSLLNDEEIEDFASAIVEAWLSTFPTRTLNYPWVTVVETDLPERIVTTFEET